MKKVLIAAFAAMLMVGCSEEADAGDIYVQGGLGNTKYGFDGATADQSGTNYFATLGYQFENSLAVEGEYEYVSDADLADGVTSTSQNAVNFYGVGRIPMTPDDKVNLIAKAGAGYTRQKINGNSERTWYPTFALGVEWLFTDSWSVVGLVDHKVYDFTDQGDNFAANPTSYKIGLGYKF